MISNFFNIKKLNMLDILLEDFNQGVIVCDRDGRIVFYNKAYSLIDNIDSERVIGQLIEKNYLMKKNESTLRQVMRTKAPQLTHRQQYTTISGTNVDVLKDTFPIIDVDDVIGAYSIVRDVYAAKQAASDILNELLDGDEENSEIYDFSKVVFKSKKMILNMKILTEAKSTSKNIAIFATDGCESKEMAFVATKETRKKEIPIYFNCASISETDQNYIFFGDDKRKGILDKSVNNTLILENIDYLTIQTQLKLKDFIELKNLHLISIFNKYQNDIISEKRLLLEFFYKLNEVSVRIPSLNDRKEDITVYIDLFCKNLSKKVTKNIKISARAYKYLLEYNWAGNYLELINVLRNSSFFLDSDTITEDELPDYIVNYSKLESNVVPFEFSSLTDILEFTEKEIIVKALENNKYNVTKSAKELGISRQNLQYRMKRFLL